MKLGIAGSGNIVNEFMTITKFLKEVELTAIFGTRKSELILHGLREQYNIKDVFVSYNEFLKCEMDTVYIALPNHLHFHYALKALEAGKNVIIEKPLTSNYNEAKRLSNVATQNSLFIFEAISTLYLPNYKKIKELVPSLGNVKIVQCNFSQFSSKYDDFTKGKIHPVFSPEYSGGALMDLNVYNIHLVVGIFGSPKNIEYFPNMERRIDTSGVLILEYETFKCVCVAAKDCQGPSTCTIQGDLGYININSSLNFCENFEIKLNDGTYRPVNENNHINRMINEFTEFVEMIDCNDYVKCRHMMEHSIIVSNVLTTARTKSGVCFPADKALD